MIKKVRLILYAHVLFDNMDMLQATLKKVLNPLKIKAENLTFIVPRTYGSDNFLIEFLKNSNFNYEIADIKGSDDIVKDIANRDKAMIESATHAVMFIEKGRKILPNTVKRIQDSKLKTTTVND